MTRIFAPLIGVSVLAMCGLQSYQFFQSVNEPFVYHRAWTDTPRVRAGEPVSLRYDFTRYRFCKVELDRYILRQHDDLVVWRERIPGGATGLGQGSVKNDMTLPNLLPGKYIFRVIAYAECKADVFAIQAPDIAFEVVP